MDERRAGRAPDEPGTAVLKAVVHLNVRIVARGLRTAELWRIAVFQRRFVVAALAAALVIAAAAPAAAAQDKVITVFAAASMKNALDDVDAAFTKQELESKCSRAMRQARPW